MKNEILNTTILAFAFLMLFALAELLYHRFRVRAELTRKLVHFGTGVLTLLFPVMLNNHWAVLFLCASFALIIITSLRFNFLKSINAIDRKSHGSITYPLAVFCTYCFYEWSYSWHFHFGSPLLSFYLPVLTLAICDPLAALCGKRWPLGRYTIGSETKSLMGSSVFFVSAFILCFVLCRGAGFSEYPHIQFTSSAFVALLATLAEGLSKKGLDNIFIPFTVMPALYSAAAFWAQN